VPPGGPVDGQSCAMSTTRLLLLGAVRIFQPVHGYLLRRELLSWQVEEWAHVKPGSIYSGLRTLVSHGLLDEVPGDPVSYRLTSDGEVEFRRLLVTALRAPDPGDASRLLGGLCFMTVLPRAEVHEALRARGLVLEAMMSSASATVRSLEESRLAPASTVELSLVIGHWLQGERTWVQELCGRIDDGHYRFAGDPEGPDLPAQGVWPPAVLDPPERP
jgi:DNA-binding PadR family transcriptional regulator